MEHTHHQKIYHPKGIHIQKMGASGQTHIGCENQNSCQELEKCPVDTRYMANAFIEQYHRRIKYGSTQAEQNPNQITAAPSPADAYHQHQSQCGHDKTEHLAGGKLFLKEEGTCHGYDDRGEIIAKGSHCNRGIPVCLKKQYPVDSNGRP